MKTTFNFNSGRAGWWAALLLAAGCYRQPPAPASTSAPEDPPEVALGERLFRDGRFSQFFFAHSAGDLNAPLAAGDPALAQTQTLGRPLPGPYAGSGMSCASCHLVDEQLDTGMRAYDDFARRSPIPDRGDGRTHTARNTPTMVSLQDATVLHYDGQFPSPQALVKGTLTGRNFGWLPTETPAAIAHIAAVIRADDGSLAEDLVPYRASMAGAAWLPYRIPEALRVDVAHASDDEIFDGVARLIAAYMESLTFSKDPNGDFDGSPYDQFLRRNALPLHPAAGERARDYAGRLAAAVDALADPIFITDGSFKFHGHPFQFGAVELAGLRTFLGEGGCASCHPPPAFTDFSFHNTGVTQESYDARFGDGAFAALAIPGLTERDPDVDLPPSAAHPRAKARFLDDVDLGLWNVFANPAVPDPQDALRALVCPGCSDEDALPKTIARFKTPSLRDLGHSAPYMHDGAFDTLEDVLAHYRRSADLARAKRLRNGAPALAAVHIDDRDALAAFLRSLDEDYH